MKNGFNYQGAEINTMGGSFGRIQSSAQWGKQIDNFSVYGALEGLRDGGFRNFSESKVRRFYGDVGYRDRQQRIPSQHGCRQQQFWRSGGGAGRIAAELLGRDLYDTADDGQSGWLCQSDRKSRGHADLDDRWLGARPGIPAEDGGRQSDRHRAMCRRSDPALLQRRRCAGKRSQWCPARKSLPNRRRAGADRPDNDPFDDDRGDPAGHQHRPVVRTQQPVHGRHQFRLRRHPLRGQRRTGHDRFKLRRQRQRHIPRTVRHSDFDRPGRRFAPPTATPASMRSTRST